MGCLVVGVLSEEGEASAHELVKPPGGSARVSVCLEGGMSEFVFCFFFVSFVWYILTSHC